MPRVVYPIVAVTALGVAMLGKTAYHAIFQSREVHVSMFTRKDERDAA
jgi:hypothetical protein